MYACIFCIQHNMHTKSRSSESRLSLTWPCPWAARLRIATKIDLYTALPTGGPRVSGPKDDTIWAKRLHMFFTCLHIYIFTYIHTYILTYMHICIYAIHKYKYTYIHIYKYMWIYIYIHVYAYIYTLDSITPYNHHWQRPPWELSLHRIKDAGDVAGRRCSEAAPNRKTRRT